MKYQVSARLNTGFVQIHGFSQSLKVEAPLAFQARGGAELIARLMDILEEGLTRLVLLDVEYHTKAEAARTFHEGFVIFKPGSPALTLIGCERFLTLVVGNRPVGDGPLNDVPALFRALKAEQAILAKSQ